MSVLFRGVCVSLVVFFLGLGISSTSLAESADLQDRIIEHLEFLGYQCDQIPQGIKATHSSKLGFLLVVLKDGLMAQSALAGKNSLNTTENSTGPSRYSAVNVLNQETAISRFFWTPSGELVMRASMLGQYEKGRFYTFMEAWEKDGQRLGKHAASLQPFLK